MEPASTRFPNPSPARVHLVASRMRLVSVVLLALAVSGLSACGTVDPTADYEEAARLIRERTGSSEVFDPRLDAEAVRRKVRELLEGGLTADAAVQVALLKNSHLQSLFADVGISRADVVQAGLLSNPSLSFSSRFPEGGGTTNLTFNIAQNITDLLLLPFRKKVAESRLEEKRLEVARQAVELMADVKRAVYRLLSLDQAERIAGTNVDLLQRSLDLAVDRLNAGDADKLDVDLARANRLDVERELATLRRDRQMARAELARLLGLARWAEPWTLAGELPRPTALEGDDALLREAVEQRLDVRIAAMQVETARRQLNQEYMRIVPHLELGAEVERPESPPTIGGPTVALSFPLFDQNLAQVARARFTLARQSASYEDLLDVVAEEVNLAAAAVRGNGDLVRLYEARLLPQAQEAFESARRAYEAGLRDNLALIRAEAHLIELRRAHIANLRDYATALADLEQALGGKGPPASGAGP